MAARNALRAANQGRSGLFAQTPRATHQIFTRHNGLSMALVRWTKALYTLTLPPDPVTNKYDHYELDPFAKEALDWGRQLLNSRG